MTSEKLSGSLNLMTAANPGNCMAGVPVLSSYFCSATTNRMSGSVCANTSSVRSLPEKKIPIMFSKKINPEVRSPNSSSLDA